MLIECPFCHARAQIPESKEGSKVRCGECGRVYGARPAGGRRGSQTNPTPFVVGGLLVVVGAILFSIINKHEPPAPPTQVVEDETPPPPSRGWDAPAVQTVLRWHKAASAGQRAVLAGAIDGATVHAIRAEQARAAAEEAAAEGAEPAALEGLLAKGWTELQSFEKQAQLDTWVDELLDTSNEDAIANWTPFDGGIEVDNNGILTIHVDCQPAAGGADARKFEWVLVEEGDGFVATRWGRWVDPDAVTFTGGRRDKGYDKVTLSDGSVVHERQPEPLEHLESTPPELRAEIESMYADIINMDLTKEQSRAKARLVEIGKPAIPRLLTGLYEIELTDDDKRRQANNVVQVLRDISGQYFGYAPMEGIGGALSTTEERRQSSIKQWFAWWHKKGKRFEEAEKVDALDAALGEMTDEERRWLERNKD